MKKTSFPKQDIKVLLLEGVARTAVETFRAAGYSNIEFHEKSLPEAELAAARNIDPQQYEHLQGLVRYSGVQLALKRRKR